MSAARQSLNGPQIIEFARSILRPGKEEPVEISKSGLARLQRAVGGLETSGELLYIVEELLHIARFLDLEKKSPKASSLISAVAVIAADAYRAVEEGRAQIGEAIAHAAQEYRSFTASDHALAQKVGAKPPEGTVLAVKFQPMRRV